MKSLSQRRTPTQQNSMNSRPIQNPNLSANLESMIPQSQDQRFLAAGGHRSMTKSDQQIQSDSLKRLIKMRSNQQRLNKESVIQKLRSHEVPSCSQNAQLKIEPNKHRYSIPCQKLREQYHKHGFHNLYPRSSLSNNSRLSQDYYSNRRLGPFLQVEGSNLKFQGHEFLCKLYVCQSISRYIKFLRNLESVKSLLPALALDQQLALSLEVHQLQEIATPALYQLLQNVSSVQTNNVPASHFKNQLSLKPQRRNSFKYKNIRLELLDHLQAVPHSDAIIFHGNPRPQLRRNGTRYRSSPFRGVFRNGRRFQIFVMIDGKNKLYRGGFKEPKEASYLYDKAVIQLRGLKARTNHTYTKSEVLSIVNEQPVFKSYEIDQAPKMVKL